MSPHRGSSEVNLLISDVDGTLLGDDDALARLVQWLEPRRSQIKLVYNSGRFFDSVVESVRTSLLPEPDAIIGGVGTQIYHFQTGLPLGSWHDELARSWSVDIIREALASLTDLELQPDEFQSSLKLSYYLYDADAEQLAAIRAKVDATGIAPTIVYSSRRDLDLLPRGADKGRAARWLARHWQIPSQAVCVSGDSGNDAALFAQGFRGIVVGNAHPELKQLTGPDVYLADACFAAGVLEGLQHWWPHLHHAMSTSSSS